MNDYFDVFFHQQAIPFTMGTVLYQKDSTEEIVDACETLYERSTGDFLTFLENDEISEKIISSPIKKHVEIQFFQAQLNWDVLLEELEELFPQFIWTKIVEEVDGIFSTYFCEFIPISFASEEEPIQFIVSASLQQMGYSKSESVSSILEAKLLASFQEEEQMSLSSETLTFPVEVSIEENVENAVDVDFSFLDDDSEEEEISEVEPRDEVEITAVTRSEESEVLFLKESLKREKASKERVRVAKEKLEYELLAIENSLLVSGLKRFKKHQKSSIDEEDWYKPVRIDLIKYDDLYKKAKFIEQSWRLNRQLVTTTEKMTVTKDQWVYERARIEKIKNSVSEMDLQSMMEQCHLINERVKIRPGFLFLKPRVKLYQIDYEQLEKISAFFDIIQTENRLLESVIEQKEFDV
ncbi:hypothetical protein UAW_01430 [Enterococcus haemoperoxidus ATCC BAA-382]|uniref:Uncharacterized protein n=1 Tax=Enterococcus haemoperoxidus ATCC BAA-382 TaxID=1158608 RepID=R2TDF3_9ENTE|nr:hypothetical protein [Enterococcus haemoperoxidus]EOH98249.1 hypothetical protein UAW_01430 [Enterococcus haemoperoxidus ATCC BAA-382]EOT59762.1 hypothetical protein I583_02397 [Enterococcus haemoperoxidus ATCC BAA-382]OJG55943.1 hypothetical protein RV06_GL000059 [Enterococcus haemoperoxidus]